MASCLSGRLSVTLRYRGHTGLNFWKIISRLINLTFLLSADPTSQIYLKGNTPNFSWNRSGVWKNWLWAYKTGNISETVEDRAKVTINGLKGMAYIKSYTGFRLPPKCVTLNDL